MTVRNALRAGIAALALGLAACSSGTDIASPGATSGTPPSGGGGGGTPVSGLTSPSGSAITELVTVDAALTTTGNVTLENVPGRAYVINGRIDVGQDVGSGTATQAGVAATLTIAAGATLVFDSADDMIIVNRGSRIIANGTATAPIIFTSRADLEGKNDSATSTRQWGGIIMLGRAPIRGCNVAVAQGSASCENAVEGVTAATGRQAVYGGATPTDSSGSLRYVQIRYPGAFLTSAAAGDDLNGLTLGGVGSGTVIDHVQVHNSGDDGIEVFGGTVNMKNIVLTGTVDDSLDYDDGWQGAVQYLVIRQTAISGGPDRMVEASNRSGSSTGNTIFTNPTIANFTMIGLPTNSANSTIRGIELNATGGTPGSSGRYLNGVVAGTTTCLHTDGANTTLVPRFDSTLFDCVGALGSSAQAIVAAGSNNSTSVANTLQGLLPGPTELARTAVNPATVNSFFDAATYVGAFSGSETAGANWATGWTSFLFNANASACPTGTVENGTVGSQRRCTLAGTLGANGVPASVRLSSGNVYELSGRVDIGVDRGAAGTAGVAASLTIDPGVTVFGKNSGDMLIVNRGSQIFVNGTKTAPVIMTSLADLSDPARSDTSTSREWAGLIVLGRGPIRGCNSAVAQATVACENAIEGVTAGTGRQALYGGAAGTDNSGRISHLQIRYPGAFLTSAAAGDDLNGLTLGGVGSATVIENVQVHNSGDDGIEVFGGTVNMKRIVLTGTTDDSLDYDDGWRGKVQFAIIVQNPISGGPDRIVEASNRKGSSSDDTLFTNPQIANFTFVGLPTNSASSAIRGIELNATGGTPGSSGVFVNGVVTGSTTCLNADAANTTAPNVPQFNSVLFDCTGAYAAPATTLINAGTNNSTATANTLAPAVVGGRPFINGANETARTVFSNTSLNTASDTFFTATTYIGAVKDTSDTWWQGWTCRLDSTSC